MKVDRVLLTLLVINAVACIGTFVCFLIVLAQR